MAATGMVRSGSEARIERYVDTMSNAGKEGFSTVGVRISILVNLLYFLGLGNHQVNVRSRYL